jgi:LemA protein
MILVSNPADRPAEAEALLDRGSADPIYFHMPSHAVGSPKTFTGGATVTLIVILAIVVVLGSFVVSVYNGLVRARDEVKNAWDSIDVQLKRRHDLIPNLVETVKGYAAHERGTLDAVVKARQQAVSFTGSVEERAKVENMLTQSLLSLFAVAEAYPDLKANQNFLKLQEEVAGTENKIGFARQYYNDATMRYKNRIEMFPSNVIAGMFNFQPEPFFQLEEPGERAVPQVKF